MKTIEEKRQAAQNTNELADHLRRIIEQNNDRYSFEFGCGGELAKIVVFDKKEEISYGLTMKKIECDENGIYKDF